VVARCLVCGSIAGIGWALPLHYSREKIRMHKSRDCGEGHLWVLKLNTSLSQASVGCVGMTISVEEVRGIWEPRWVGVEKVGGGGNC
jgi:hypothetical protein